MSAHFIAQSQARGFVHQATNLESLDVLMRAKKISAYAGFDPTAQSLHVGNLVSIMWLRLLEQCGHQPIVILGGATAAVGDPTGKNKQRTLMDADAIQHNAARIKKTFQHYLRNPIILNNLDWLSGIPYLTFLRDYGVHFSVNRMLTFDTMKTRLDNQQSLSFLEFNYMILQAYDFLHLHETQDCVLQMGGSDQWGNIVNGVELIHKVKRKEVFGLTSPLITTSAGQKMGKTEGGAVWLDADLLSPFDYWQFWRNTDDKDVVRYLKLYTDLPMHEILELAQLHDQEINVAKKVLADETTKLAHGVDVLDAIHQAATDLFYTHDVAALDSVPLVMLSATASYRLDELLVLAELCASKGEAKKAVLAGSIKINNEKMWDPLQHIAVSSEPILLSFGKKRHVRIGVQS